MAAAVSDILDGAPLHPAIVDLTARLVAKGVDTGDVHDLVAALLARSARASDKARMKAALDHDLPNAIKGAVTKITQAQFRVIVPSRTIT